MTTLILLLGFSSWLAFDKGLCNNPYSSHHNVWTYTFQSKKYEEEHRTKEEDPTLLATQYVKLSYFGYPNINLPSVIVSQQLTAFLKSLTDTEYETAIKPILTEAAIRAPNTCLYDEWCDDQLNEYIASEDFIIAVKEILNEIISLTPLSTYLDILLQEQKYLWYKMYWSLDTSIDNPPIITYDKFNPIYRMCFCGVPFDIVVKVSNSMDDMLNSGYNETGLSYLYSLAPSWLDCIDHEYKISVLILENNRDKWANNFLYNLTTYIKAKTMMEYLLFDIQHIDYELTTPHKLKRILHYGEEEWLFKPMIYSLYLPTFLKPYIKYMTALLSDRHDVITSPNLANLTLETTIFGETVPFNNTTDNTARSFISYTNSFAITANDNKKNSSKLLDFVKYITKTVVRGYVVVHYPIFGMMYNSYTFIDSVYNMIYHKEEDNHKKRSQYTLLSLTDANEPPHYSLDPWLLACKKAPFNVTKHGYHAVAPHKGNHNLRNNYDIKYLRKIAPKKKNTIELLQKIKLPLSPHPLGIDLNLLNTECKKFVGSLAIQSDSPMANYLAKIIELYKVLRRIRPYDFYSEETELVLFIKANYNLWHLNHFGYFQGYMLLCLQFIISVLTNPTFKYNPINANKVQAKVHISTLTCELTFDNNDITSLAINLRTMWNSKKILPAYHGESGILYRTYLSCIAARNLNKHELQTVYWRYKNNKQKFNIGRDSTEKLYSMLEDHHFKMYAFLQDPVIFAKIVDDLLVKLETKPQS